MLSISRFRLTSVGLAIAVVLSCAAAARAQTLTATLTAPLDGAVNVSPLAPYAWTTVADAQAYVLWIGTSLGANNVVNTVELQDTSLPAQSVPAGVTLYARIWTRVGGVWRSVDSTFTAASLTATLTAPANGASNVNPLQPIQWTSVPNVQGYVLWIGTSAGGSNVVNTDELQQTSYQPASLPSNQTLYARIWAKVGGVWRYTDSTFTAAALTATLTAPANGATNVNPLQSVQWTAVPNAQAYVLWIGTAAGGSNIVNTVELQQTSYQPASLPSNQTLYARIWTKVGGVWRYTDSTFSAAALTSRLTAPVNGATNVGPTPTFEWTGILNSQGYVLWLGSTAGGHELFATDELAQTSMASPISLAVNQTIYARMWAKAGGVWRFTDSSFATQTVPAAMTSPSNGATNVNSFAAMTWTSAVGAEAYVLWVGTSAGASNLINTVELHQTSYTPSGLPSGQTLYARIWTRLAGAWFYTDSTFTAAPLKASLIYPANGAQNVDDSVPASWTAIPGAQSYVLWVGSAPGTHDVFFPTETTQTVQPIAGLLPNRQLYARLWTKVSGIWRFNDSTFEVSSIPPEFVAPLNGQVGVDPAAALSWTIARNASAYELQIGTTPGGVDVTDSGEIAGTSFVVAGLASHTGPLYARIWAKVDNFWNIHNDIVFTLDPSAAAAVIDTPFDGDAAFQSSQPFEWAPVALARAYRLTIGTSFGAADLHDSGAIHITRRFVRGLPTATPLYGRLQTQIDGVWHSTDFTFIVSSNTPSASLELKSAFWATDLVRTMAATIDNRPYGWTPLFTGIYPIYAAICSTFSATLVQMLAEMNLSLDAHTRDIAFDTNRVDGHTLVEVWNPDTSRWVILDPTFDLTVRRLDNEWATVEELSAATQAFAWGDVNYVFLGLLGDAVARAYTIDYPLLYLNVTGDVLHGTGLSPVPYLTEMPMPASGATAIYAIRCAAATADVVVDGVTRTMACDGIDGLSVSFAAATVAVPASSTTAFQLYRFQRFVF